MVPAPFTPPSPRREPNVGKKAKAKPMRVWVIVHRDGGAAVDVFDVRASAIRYNRHYSSEACRSRVVEFVAVTPRKRQKGKSK